MLFLLSGLFLWAPGRVRRKIRQAPTVAGSVSKLMAGRILQSVIQLGAAAWVARLLTPAEIGLFAVSAAFLLIINGLRGFGIGPYLIRKEKIEAADYQTGFSLALLIGILLAALLTIAAPLIARAYGAAEMTAVLRILSINFITFPFLMLAQTRATRANDFGWLALVELVTACIAAGVSVVLAANGYSYFALAWASVVFTFFSSLLCAIRYFSLSDYRPSIKGATSILAFGTWITGSTLIQQLNTAINDILIGKLQGLVSAGIFDRAASVNRLVSDQLYPAVGQVLFARFAAENRDFQDLAKAYFYRLRCLMDFIAPILVGLVIFGDYAVVALFGNQWVAAGPIAQILAFAALCSVPFTIARELGGALGAVRAFFIIDLLVLVVRIAAVTVGATISLEVAAASLILPNIIYAVMTQRAVLRIVKADGFYLWALLRKTGLVMTLLATALVAVRFAIEAHIINLYLKTLLALAAGGGCMLIALFAGRSPLIKSVKDQFLR